MNSSEISRNDSLRTVPFGTDVSEVIGIVNEDGGVILEGVLTESQISALNADIDSPMTALRSGTSNDVERSPGFHGALTKRLTNLVTHSRIFREEIMADPNILQYIDAMLLPTGDSYWMTTAQVIEILPGERAQILHRDLDNYPFFNTLGNDGPEVQTNLLIPLSGYTEKSGATRIIPRSHLWDNYLERGDAGMTIPAIMKPGSGLLISGKVVHGGGANRTRDVRRRVLTLGYNPGWTVPEEAYPFIVPMEIAKSLPRRAQQLIGFRSFHNASNNGGSLWQNNYFELAGQLGL